MPPPVLAVIDMHEHLSTRWTRTPFRDLGTLLK